MASVLKRGSKGAAVKDLQRLLNAAGASPRLQEDGDFGAGTNQAARDFQRLHGLVVDGLVGSRTLTALKQAASAPKAGKPEPVKDGMMDPVPETDTGWPKVLDKPANASSLKLLDTARPIDEIIVHCTATAEGKDYTVADIRAWHKQRGFSDIGYHYVVYRDGRVMVGRPVGQIGAHVEGHNTGTIGISYIGGLDANGQAAKDTRTDAQRSSLIWLVEQLVKKFPVKKVTGHNQYAAKACPSFDVRKDPLSQIV